MSIVSLDGLIGREFNKVLKEGRTERITQIEAIDKLQPHLREFGDLIRTPNIFRGKSGASPYGFIEPSNFTRRSENTSNYYTLIIDNSEKWDPWPKRSKSIVCTTNASRADAYGDVLSVFPEIGADIGVCPAYDIWHSFSVLEQELNIPNLDQFNIFLEYLFEWAISDTGHTDLVDEELSGTNFSRFRSQIERIPESQRFEDLYQKGKSVGDMPGDNFPNHIERRIKKAAELFYPNYTTFFEFLEDMLNPHKNGFMLKKYDRNVKLSQSTEVWMSADSVLVSYEKVKLLNKKLEES